VLLPDPFSPMIKVFDFSAMLKSTPSNNRGYDFILPSVSVVEYP
jgi:hypothetical protein